MSMGGVGAAIAELDKLLEHSHLLPTAGSVSYQPSLLEQDEINSGLMGNTRSLAEQEQDRYEAHMRGEDIRRKSYDQEQIAWEVLTKMAEAGSSWRDIEGVSMQLGLMLFMARKSDMETLERIYGKDFYDPLKQEVKP